MLVEILVLLGVTILVQIILEFKSRRQVFKWFAKRNIPGPKPHLFFGNRMELRRKPNANDVLENWIKTYGNVFGYFYGKKPHLVVNDLELIQKIFIGNNKSFRDRPAFVIDVAPLNASLICLRGERWRTIRKIVSTTFSQNKVQSSSIKETINKCVDNVLHAIDPQQQKEPIVVDVYERMQAFTLDVIAKTALNMDNNVHQKGDMLMNAVREFFEHASNSAVEIGLMVDFLKPVIQFIYKYITAGRMTDMVVNHLKAQVKQTIRRSVDGDNVKSFLHSMLRCFANGDITEQEFIGNLFIIILAGYETTANGLTYLLYLLATHKHIQHNLRMEIGKDGKESTYLDTVWMETLRLYPPVTLFVTRDAAEDTVIDDLFIEKGTKVQLPVWHIHHREDLWENPFEFNPLRFSAENRKEIHPCAYLPFGLGSRICIGMHLANLEVNALICRLLSSYEIDTCEKTPIPLELKCPTVIINPSTPVYLKLTPI